MLIGTACPQQAVDEVGGRTRSARGATAPRPRTAGNKPPRRAGRELQPARILAAAAGASAPRQSPVHTTAASVTAAPRSPQELGPRPTAASSSPPTTSAGADRGASGDDDRSGPSTYTTTSGSSSDDSATSNADTRPLSATRVPFEAMFASSGLTHATFAVDQHVPVVGVPGQHVGDGLIEPQSDGRRVPHPRCDRNRGLFAHQAWSRMRMPCPAAGGAQIQAVDDSTRPTGWNSRRTAARASQCCTGNAGEANRPMCRSAACECGTTGGGEGLGRNREAERTGGARFTLPCTVPSRPHADTSRNEDPTPCTVQRSP